MVWSHNSVSLFLDWQRKQARVYCKLTVVSGFSLPGKCRRNSIDMEEPQGTNHEQITDKLDNGLQEQPPHQHSESLMNQGSLRQDALICQAIPPASHIPGSCRIRGEAPDWQHLIETLSCLQSIEGERLLRSRVGLELVSRKATVYRDAGVKSFAEYVSLAQTRGIVHLGGTDGHAWIRLDSCCPQAK